MCVISKDNTNVLTTNKTTIVTKDDFLMNQTTFRLKNNKYPKIIVKFVFHIVWIAQVMFNDNDTEGIFLKTRFANLFHNPIPFVIDLHLTHLFGLI